VDASRARHGRGKAQLARGVVKAPNNKTGAPGIAARTWIYTGGAQILVHARSAVGAQRHLADVLLLLTRRHIDDSLQQIIGRRGRGDRRNTRCAEECGPGRAANHAVNRQRQALAVQRARLEQLHGCDCEIPEITVHVERNRLTAGVDLRPAAKLIEPPLQHHDHGRVGMIETHHRARKGCTMRSVSLGSGTASGRGTSSSAGTLMPATSMRRRSSAMAPICPLTAFASNTPSRTNLPFR